MVSKRKKKLKMIDYSNMLDDDECRLTSANTEDLMDNMEKFEGIDVTSSASKKFRHVPKVR